jgi:hypothetical protein
MGNIRKIVYHHYDKTLYKNMAHVKNAATKVKQIGRSTS